MVGGVNRGCGQQWEGSSVVASFTFKCRLPGMEDSSGCFRAEKIKAGL